LTWGLEPGQLDTLSADDQRQFIADVFQAEPNWTFDSLNEGLSRLPSKRVELEQALREGDFMQMGAVIDYVCRRYVIESCRDYWESEFTQVQEQESTYDGD
jgi:hypothetical protein